MKKINSVFELLPRSTNGVILKQTLQFAYRFGALDACAVSYVVILGTKLFLKSFEMKCSCLSKQVFMFEQAVKLHFL